MPAIRSRARAATAVVALLSLAAGDSLTAAQPVATMVADIAQVIPTSTPINFSANRQPRSLPANLGAFTYFYGDDGVHGRELWRSDGTPGGTAMVRDTCPGRCGAAALYSFLSIARAGSRLYFAADDGVHGQELWAIDGEAGEPQLVADLVPGARGSSPGSFQPVGDRLFFLARDPIEGGDLWVSDGTGQGTHRVADLRPGPDSFSYGASADLGGVLLFGSNGPLSGLWRSDGTPAGTYSISPVEPWQYSWPQGAPFLVFGDRLLFWGRAPSAPETTLWVSDGTSSGTTELLPQADPWNFARCGDAVYFSAGNFPRQLYRTQGTPETTLPVPLPDGVRTPSYYGRQACAGSRFLFAGDDEDHGAELWVASESGASLLADIAPGAASSLALDIADLWSGAGKFLASLGDQVILLADDGAHGTEPWISDGTPEGTHLVLETNPGSTGLAPGENTLVTPRPEVGGALLFRERAGDGSLRVWRSDGTGAGTFPVATLEDQTSSIEPPTEGLALWGAPPPTCFAPVGDGLTFAADDASTGRELWFTSTRSGLTSRVLDFVPGPRSSSPIGCHPFGGKSIFFGVDDPDLYTGGLLALDGATGEVELLGTGQAPPAGALPAARFEHRLYLTTEWIWRTSGAASETENLGALGSSQIEVAAAGDALFFGASELYRFDRETSGFAPLTPATVDGHYPVRMTAHGPDLLFFTWQATTGTELWRSDGTPEGTGLVVDLRPGPPSSIYEPFYFPGQPELTRIVPLGSISLFAADDGVHGEELWRTDGTAAGTVMVRDLFPGAYPSSPRELVRVGDYVFFSAEAADAGRELWVSNGYSGATRKVADLVPGAGSSVPQELAAIRDELWFSAWTPAFGREPWRLRRGAGNGVVAERLGDLAPGPLSSSPLIFKNAGADVYTVANDNVHGFELWKLRDADLLFADDFESSGLALWSPAAP